MQPCGQPCAFDARFVSTCTNLYSHTPCCGAQSLLFSGHSALCYSAFVPGICLLDAFLNLADKNPGVANA
jgi:hypothetical protein